MYFQKMLKDTQNRGSCDRLIGSILSYFQYLSNVSFDLVSLISLLSLESLDETMSQNYIFLPSQRNTFPEKVKRYADRLLELAQDELISESTYISVNA